MSNGFRSKKLKAIRPPVLPGLALSSMKKTTSESHSYYLSIYIYIYTYTHTLTCLCGPLAKLLKLARRR